MLHVNLHKAGDKRLSLELKPVHGDCHDNFLVVPVRIFNGYLRAVNVLRVKVVLINIRQRGGQHLLPSSGKLVEVQQADVPDSSPRVPAGKFSE